MNCDPEINTGTENFASKGIPVFIKPGGYFFVDVIDDGSLGHYLVSFPEPGGCPAFLRCLFFPAVMIPQLQICMNKLRAAPRRGPSRIAPNIRNPLILREMRAQTGFFLMFGRSSRPHERSCGHDAPSAFPHCLFIHIMHFFVLQINAAEAGKRYVGTVQFGAPSINAMQSATSLNRFGR